MTSLGVDSLQVAEDLRRELHLQRISASPEGQAFAQGRIDAGQQRAEMITQLKALKNSVDSLSQKLSDGSVTVKVEGGIEND